MTPRIHHQISAMFMADDNSKLEVFNGYKEWVSRHPDFLNWMKYRLITSDNRVYISEPNGLFYEEIKYKEKCNKCCPKRLIFGKLNDYSCKKCRYNIGDDTRTVYCSECDRNK